jgi:CheY-like chemotaxis protein
MLYNLYWLLRRLGSCLQNWINKIFYSNCHVKTLLVTAIVVDDYKDTVSVFAEYLGLLGVHVVAVGYDGKEAVELYKKHTPDVLFLDLSMPKYDGIYALKEIRAFDPKSKIIIVTAGLEGNTEQELERLRPTGLFFKPFDMEKIKEMLEYMVHPQDTNMIDNEKKALVSFTIAQAIDQISPSTTDKVGNRLYEKYGCYFSDCLEHPEYLADVLKEIFGNGSVAIVKIIRERLAEFETQQPISNFLTVISK